MRWREYAAKVKIRNSFSFLIYYSGYDSKNRIYKEDSKFNLVSQKYSLIKKVVSRELEALSFDEIKDLYSDVEYNVKSIVLFSQMLWVM